MVDTRVVKMVCNTRSQSQVPNYKRFWYKTLSCSPLKPTVRSSRDRTDVQDVKECSRYIEVVATRTW